MLLSEPGRPYGQPAAAQGRHCGCRNTAFASPLSRNGKLQEFRTRSHCYNAHSIFQSLQCSGRAQRPFSCFFQRPAPTAKVLTQVPCSSACCRPCSPWVRLWLRWLSWPPLPRVPWTNRFRQSFDEVFDSDIVVGSSSHHGHRSAKMSWQAMPGQSLCRPPWVRPGKRTSPDEDN